MIGWTLCSGIGAPEISAPGIDWRLSAEIEDFPRAVLCERHGFRSARRDRGGAPELRELTHRALHNAISRSR